MPRLKKTARVDGPWPGPMFSLAQAGLSLGEEAQRYIQERSIASQTSEAPQSVSSGSGSETDLETVAAEEASDD